MVFGRSLPRLPACRRAKLECPCRLFFGCVLLERRKSPERKTLQKQPQQYFEGNFALEVAGAATQWRRGSPPLRIDCIVLFLPYLHVPPNPPTA
jgi:hypothetical protein